MRRPERYLPRRRFLAAGAAAAGAAALGRWPWSALAARPPLDLLLRGGTVLDGTGSAGIRADVGVRDGRIVAIELLPDAEATVVLDVSGHVVCPGFVDIHGHTDLGIFVDNRADSKIRQGVTTEAVGQDGSSVLPVTDAMRARRRERYLERYGVEVDFGTWDDLFAALGDRGHLANFVTMVGSGTVREVVVGDEARAATPEELVRMVGLVEAARDAGVVGISSGLEYTPNAFATADELVALARPFLGTDLPYASHLRNEADLVEEALTAGIDVAVQAGVPFQASHLKAQGQRNWHRGAVLIEIIETAAETHPVRFDRYPYTAYSTGLASLFPAWAKDGGTEAFLARLGDPAQEDRLRAAVDEKIDMMGDWNAIQIASVEGEAPQDVVGRRLGSYAEEKGRDPYVVTVEILVGSENRTSIVGHGMGETNTARFLAHRLGAICSDASARRSEGPLSEGTPHPRAYGSFPRVLGKYVREDAILSLAEAVRKMTSLPAAILGLADRGTIQPGKAADLVVFDPETVADTATFEAPHSYPEGISHVVVNGRLAVRDGRPTGAMAGQVVTPA